MSRIARHLARGFLVAWVFVALAFGCVALGLAGAGLEGLTTDRLGVVPDGVWLALVPGALAAGLLVVHLRRTGELRAASVGGARPALQSVWVGGLALCLTLVVAWRVPGRAPGLGLPGVGLPGARSPGARSPGARLQRAGSPGMGLPGAGRLEAGWPEADPSTSAASTRSGSPALAPRIALDGSLALGDRVVWWAEAPAPHRWVGQRDFVDRPRRPGRFRLRLFLARAPWEPTDHPLDPTLLRWVGWLLGGFALPWWLCARALAGRFGW